MVGLRFNSAVISMALLTWTLFLTANGRVAMPPPGNDWELKTDDVNEQELGTETGWFFYLNCSVYYQGTSYW
jgi:hypothetical protein